MNENEEILKTIEELKIECENVDCDGKNCKECFMFRDECILAKITGKLLKIEDKLKCQT